MSTALKRTVSPTEYLAIERRAEYKSEYFRGEMFAMAGGSRRHSLIGANLLFRLSQQLEGRSCEVHHADMRGKVSATGLYTYPDIAVVCGAPEMEDAEQDTLLNPVVLMEVLSPSTEGYDRGVKFQHYRQIVSLMAYVLIAQDEPHVECFSRQRDGGWLLWETSDRHAQLSLPAIACELRLTEVYDKVEFEPTEADAAEPDVPTARH
jgi:Uma2 family endonuclease